MSTDILFVVVVAATVVVSPVPSFQAELVTSPEGYSIYHPAGDPFNITCRVLDADDSKICSMRWINNDGNVIPEGIPGVEKDGKNGIKLEFTSPKIEESGIYKCEAAYFSHPYILEKTTNIIFHGNETDDATSSIVKVEVKNITFNSVEFFILVSGSVKFIEVEGSKIRGSRIFTKWEYGAKYEVKDLYPGGEYSFRFRSVPSKKRSWSDDYAVTLLPDKQEMILENIAKRTVELSWNHFQVSIDYYELKYFQVEKQLNGWSSGSCVTTIQIPSCKRSSYTIAGLSPGAFYELQFRAHTAAGYGESQKQKIYLRD